MSFVPHFILYDSTDTSIQYTFPVVFEAPTFPHSEKKLVELENLRAQGSIIIDAGNAAYDITLKGVLSAASYTDLIALIDDMETDVALNTKYVLHIQKDSNPAHDYTYKVKRKVPIEYGETDYRCTFIEYQITLRIGCWA